MAARNTLISFYNCTDYCLILTGSNLDHGIWNQSPSGIINPNTLGDVIANNESDGVMTGDQGSLTYAILGVQNNTPYVVDYVTIAWDNPYVGINSYSCSLQNPQQSNLQISNTFGRGNNTAVSFILNKQNQFASWMSNSLSIIGNKKLTDICIPGSHDAGMSVCISPTVGASNCNTITQSMDILGQLKNGSRYFDIRPIIGGGAYETGHYSDVSALLSTQGARGQSIDDIINDINEFTASNKELVILNLSHSLDTDSSAKYYPSFTDGQWQTLFGKLKGINNLYLTDTVSYPDLAQSTINTFIGGGEACVLIIVEVDASVILPYKDEGFFPAAISLKTYNEYSGTDDFTTMMNDQINKMRTQRGLQNYFLLSWTLTQSNTAAALCQASDSAYNSVLDLAGIADGNLYQLLPLVSKEIYPNIIYVDNFNNGIGTSIAMNINSKL